VGRLTVAPGTPADVTAFLALFLTYRADSLYRDTAIDLDLARANYRRACADPTSLVLIARDCAQVVGALVAWSGRNFFGMTASGDYFTYALPGSAATAALIRRYRDWARSRGIAIVSLATSSGPNPRYERLIERLGFTRVGATFFA
jgi:GNAT superfamily N-acetyltransferase